LFRAEARWLGRLLAEHGAVELSPLLNVGSSTRAFRETDQPWTEQELFAPLRARGVRIIHLDARSGDGIDIKADILDDRDLAKVRALAPRAILLCNILEHVTDPQKLADRCIRIVGPGGLIFVTVPFSYPFHRDPIDTLYRPSPEALVRLFDGARALRAEIVDAEESFRDQVKKRPWILSRQVLRFPFPFLGLTKWRRSMGKLYWLFHNYQVTGAVFRVPGER
jgi:hypothetical protein